jgi:heptosyltransferase II
LQRILFLAEGQLGDLLLLTPALRATKESFPDSFISVLVVDRRPGPSSKPNPFQELEASDAERESSVLSTNKNVDELLVVNRQSLRLLRGVKRIKAELAIVRSLRKKRFDAVLCTFSEDRFAIWAFASGAKTRIGQKSQPLHRLLTHTPDIHKAEHGVAAYYCELVKQLGATVSSETTEYHIPAKSMSWTHDFLLSRNVPSDRPIIAVHPGASAEFRIWPPEHFAAAIEHFTNVFGATVLLLGSIYDKPIMNAIKERLRVPVIEIDEHGNISNFAAILQRCSLCISNDSGPRHMAIAVGTPSIALFRLHDEIIREWSIYEESSTIAILKGKTQCPACSTVCLDRVPEGERFGSFCIRLITVEEVIQKAESMLSLHLAKGEPRLH